MGVSLYFWVGFHVFIFTMLALDLGVFNRHAHKVKVSEAVIWSVVWISLAILFNLFIYFEFNKVKALEFLTGYVIEYSLSVDNIFVFILIFSYFAVEEEYQHKILFWGIIGAVIMRGIFIIAGVSLINRFHWIVLIFGAFLIYSGITMLLEKENNVDPEKNLVVRFLRKVLPVSDKLHGSRLFIRQGRKTYATPLFIVLVIIESSDVIFAADSIPAILAVSKDTFIVYTSNIFAILGLRSLYFAIAGLMGYFRFLKIGLAFVLTFVGVKMLASFFDFEIPIVFSLGIIVIILFVSVLVSIFIKKKPE